MLKQPDLQAGGTFFKGKPHTHRNVNIAISLDRYKYLQITFKVCV